MGYKCRIAIVLLLLLTSIAALIAVAIIQDTWMSKEYSLEVSTYTHKCVSTYLLATGLLYFHIHKCSKHIHTEHTKRKTGNTHTGASTPTYLPL